MRGAYSPFLFSLSLLLCALCVSAFGPLFRVRRLSRPGRGGASVFSVICLLFLSEAPWKKFSASVDSSSALAIPNPSLTGTPPISAFPPSPPTTTTLLGTNKPVPPPSHPFPATRAISATPPRHNLSNGWSTSASPISKPCSPNSAPPASKSPSTQKPTPTAVSPASTTPKATPSNSGNPPTATHNFSSPCNWVPHPSSLRVRVLTLPCKPCFRPPSFSELWQPGGRHA